MSRLRGVILVGEEIEGGLYLREVEGGGCHGQTGHGGGNLILSAHGRRGDHLGVPWNWRGYILRT